jgi:hypothetical protein
MFFMFHMAKIQVTKHFKRFFGHFWENFAKILPQICTALYIFTRPLLSYAAEEVAGWEHKRNYLPRTSSSYMLCCQLLQRFPDSFNQKFRSLKKMFPGKNFVDKLHLKKNNTRFLRHQKCQNMHFSNGLNSVSGGKVKITGL